MTDHAVRINRWLRAFVYPLDAEAEITSVIVRHISVNEKLSDIQTFKVGANLSNDALSDLVKAIDDIVEDDAEGLSGVQKYVLAAIGAEKKQIGRLALRYSVSESEGGEGEMSSEPATAKGLLAQTMRHSEVFARIASAESGHVITMQQRMLGQMSGMLENLMSRHMENMQLTEELLSHRHERDMALAEQESKLQIKQDILSKVTTLLPAVIKKFTGVSADSELPPEVAELRNVARILVKDDARIDQMAQILGPEEMIAIMEFAKGDAETQTS